MDWATICATFSRNHLVTLLLVAHQHIRGSPTQRFQLSKRESSDYIVMFATTYYFSETNSDQVRQSSSQTAVDTFVFFSANVYVCTYVRVRVHVYSVHVSAGNT
jgi:hypothetical protein